MKSNSCSKHAFWTQKRDSHRFENKKSNICFVDFNHSRINPKHKVTRCSWSDSNSPEWKRSTLNNRFTFASRVSTKLWCWTPARSRSGSCSILSIPSLVTSSFPTSHGSLLPRCSTMPFIDTTENSPRSVANKRDAKWSVVVNVRWETWYLGVSADVLYRIKFFVSDLSLHCVKILTYIIFARKKNRKKQRERCKNLFIKIYRFLLIIKLNEYFIAKFLFNIKQDRVRINNWKTLINYRAAGLELPDFFLFLGISLKSEKRGDGEHLFFHFLLHFFSYRYCCQLFAVVRRDMPSVERTMPVYRYLLIDVRNKDQLIDHVCTCNTFQPR